MKLLNSLGLLNAAMIALILCTLLLIYVARNETQLKAAHDAAQAAKSDQQIGQVEAAVDEYAEGVTP